MIYGPFDLLVPSPSETWFRGIWVWEGFSGGRRVRLNLKRCSQLAAFLAIQPVG